MSNPDPSTLLSRIEQWVAEKGYLPGHRTGELLKEAAAEITHLREVNEALLKASKDIVGSVYPQDAHEKTVFGNLHTAIAKAEHGSQHPENKGTPS